MKKITLFMLPTCPYCKKAIAAMEKLQSENDAYQQIEIEMIDEQRQAELADSFDYFYVPCFYVDGVKAHEGAADEADVKSVLDAALED